VKTYSSEARSALSSDPLAARSGGHHGGQYKKQSQPAKHENFLNVAAIEFDGHLSLPSMRVVSNMDRNPDSQYEVAH
jgi:hypothetical protein